MAESNRKGREGKGTSTRRGQGRAQQSRYPQDNDESRVPRKPFGGRWGYKRLEALLSKSPQEILHTLANAQTGFTELMEQDLREKPDWVALILANSVKACTCEAIPVSLLQFLNSLRTSRFLGQGLSQYIGSMPLQVIMGKKEENLQKSIRNTLKLLQFLLEKMPNSMSEVLPIITTTDYVMKDLQKTSSVIDDETMTMLEDLLKVRNTVMEDRKKGTRREMEDPNKEHAKTPPDDFRGISAYPTKEDILNKSQPFIRKNKVRGSYQNMEHYLDVHFRLLKEDLVRPLRESVAEYLELEEESGKVQKVKDMRLYHDVHILHPVCTHEGISFRVQFDMSRLNHIRWESSRRLLYGSLVCLSSDNFNTIIFASVTNRDRALIQQGKIDLKCDTSEESQMLQSYDAQKFMMAETTTYFEAYKHVLQGLQEINTATYPFQSYFVKCKSSDRPPQYLQEAQVPVYDLRCLVPDETIQAPLTNEQMYDPESTESVTDEVYDFYADEEIYTGLPVPILENTQWPAHDKFGLDPSQNKALQAALTREVALIQGPPGTGKTFLGLKIIHTLLKNVDVWGCSQEPSEDTMSPILVVCYTNHALDQFLEGVYSFERKGIVRVGGRSKSTLLENKTIRNLRKNYREKKEFPKMVHEARINTVGYLEKLRSDNERGVAQLQASKQGILHESILFSIIPEEHWLQLRPKEHQHRRYGKASAIVQWLQVEKAAGKIKLKGDEKDAVVDLVDEGNDIEVEEDAIKITEQRTLEDEDERPGSAEDKIRHRLMMQSVVADLAAVLDMSICEENSIKPHKDQETKKEVSSKLLKMIKSLEAMTVEESEDVDDIWQLPLLDRWRLYKHWLELYRQHVLTELKKSGDQYQTASDRLKEILFEEDLYIMRCASVVGMTTTAAARYRSLLQKLKPRIIIVEEAAEVLEAHLITTLSPGCQHLIMIGDHKQLRPNPTVYELAESYKLKISLFERLVMNGIHCVTLEKQHRMRPEFASLLHHIYPRLENAESVLNRENIKGITKNLYLISHEKEECLHEDSQSKVNEHEARFVVRLCRYLLLQGYYPSQITILTPYTGQLFRIKRLMPKDTFEGVQVCAVDNFQGEENDIIILSLVRSNVERKAGFVGEDNRICVSMSRARIGFYVIGNFKMFAEKSQLWDKIIKSVQEVGCFSSALPLRCRNHPDSSLIMAKKATDFDKAPEGGCLRPCEARLNCGHVCERVCHAYDPDHKLYRCIKPCRKLLCAQKHPCPKRCHEECGPCKKIMARMMPNCGHVQKIPCHIAPFHFQCQDICTYRLSCGHMCQNKCGESHTSRCQHPVERTLPCGHRKKMLCYQEPVVSLCEVECGELLMCEHPCSGTCGSCYQGRLHQACGSDCGRTLVCGHQCTAPCTKDCPPCAKPCENRCIHSKCYRSCGLPCTPCQEPCAWKCKHHTCGRLCSEPCGRPKCEQACSEKLPCGHPCIGMCGEPCPKKCRVCDKDQVEEIFFGTEDEPDAKFVELEDCGHFFEVESLDSWMDQVVDTSEGSIDIKLKECPKCKTPIRRNLRYGNIINEAISSIEAVKEKVIGSLDLIEGEVETIRNRTETSSELDKTSKAFFLDQLENEDWNIEKLSCLKNFLSFSEAVMKYRKRVKKCEECILKEDQQFTKCYKQFQTSQTQIFEWIRKERGRLSDQEEHDVTAEITRLLYLTNIIELKNIQLTRKIELTGDMITHMEQVIALLTSGKPLMEKGETKVKTSLKELEKALPRSGLGISDEERVEILRAVGLTQGHWYKCPQGHIYAIGECGGAMQVSRCPECGSTIGGTSHRLHEGNVVATEMDGATRPAWPTAHM